VTGTSPGGVVNWANGVTASSTDRAVGFLTTGGFTSPRTIAFRFTNNTGATVTSIDLAFDYEKYRSGTRAFNWTFFHGSGTNATTAAASGDQSYAADANNTTVFNPPTAISKTFTISGLSIANGDSYTLRWTFTGVGGSTNGQGIGLDNFSITLNGTPAPVNTTVNFVGTSLPVNENAGTTNLTLAISNFSTTQATSVDVVLTSGDAARVNNYTTQTVTWAANDGANKTVTLTISDDALCNGNAALVFNLQNITGGQGAPAIGTPATRNVTITDNETPANPVATAATAVSATGFTANWDAVPGATDYSLDVYTMSPTASEDFTDGQFTSGPAWTGSTGSFSVLTDGFVPNGAASTDGSFLASNASIPNAVLLTASSEVGQWRFSWASPSFAPSSANHFGIVLMADAAVTAISQPFNGYYLRIGVDGSTDAVELWRSTNSTKTKVGDFPGSPVVAAAALTNGLNIRVTRSNSGTFELFYGTGFTYASEPVTSAGTLIDDTHSTSSYFGIYTNFGTPSSSRRNYVDNIVLGGSPGFLPGYNNANVGNVTTVNITGLDPLTTYYYVVRSTGGCSTGDDSNEINATTMPAPVYYSRSNGNVNDPIWSDTPAGTAGPAVWNSGVSMVVQAGNTVTMNNNIVEVNDLVVEATGQLVIPTERLLVVYGDQVTLAAGSISPASGEIELAGGSPVNVAVSGAVNMNNLTVNAIGGTTVTGSGVLGISGTLQLAADLDASEGTVQLNSDASRTGRLGPVPAGVTYTGNLTVQRYIPGGATNWRLLGSPVAGATVNAWQDDFITAGYPGSQFPTFSSGGQLWPSIRWYDETDLSTSSVNSGLVGVSSDLQQLAPGQGFAVWCGDNLGGTAPFVTELAGSPHIASEPIQLPMTYTSTETPSIDGWNLVSNPLPSPIRFSDLARSNVADYITYYNPATGNTSVYDISLFAIDQALGATNGATNTIQSGQAFWLKATGPSPSVVVEEADKVDGNTGGLFGGDETTTLPVLRLQITSAINTFSDQTVVLFSEGAPAADDADVLKVNVGHVSAPRIGSLATGGELMAINANGAFTSEIVIPLMVDVGVTGTYTITAGTLASSVLTCMSLEDLSTGDITPLTEGATYTFTMAASADPAIVRFQLRATAPLAFAMTDATCGGSPSGQASVEVGQSPLDVTWTDAFGNVLLQQSATTGTATLGGLSAGSYRVQLMGLGACPSVARDFTITEPFALEVQADVVDASCPGQSDGQIAIEVLGGTAPYAFAWSTGEEESSIQVGAGSYSLTVTDNNGCTTEQIFTVASAPAPEVGITVDQPLVLLGSPIQFGTSVADYDEVQWDFGDGNTSYGPEVAHTYLAPGTYTVTQTIVFGACSSSTTTEVVVELTTGVEAAQLADITVRVEGDHIVIMHPDDTKQLRYELRDAAGRLVMDRAATGSAGRVLVPAQGLATGVWVLTVRADQDVRTFRLPLVR
jgi:hypothetical protein